ncbi:DUF3179 domain-containing (seleno)protein [Paludisphaera sp.]|uniref:DUF3179 domain-containing (seleno)protein n=1 Tax=Paludisphaera sp. TaxID=2017432 RepID=UPI00301DF75A
MRLFEAAPGLARRVAPWAGLVLIAGLTVPAVFWLERRQLAAWARETEKFKPPGGGREVFLAPGVKSPPTVPAGEARLDDDEPVIGIVAGGRARAYHVRTMSDKTRHVVNDLVGGRAVTVAYCDLSDCISAYGGDEATSPLDVGVAGLVNGEMLVSVGGVAYFQETGDLADVAHPDRAAPRFPYARFPATRTTWGRWKSLHPDTDLYLHQTSVPTSPEAHAIEASGR